MSTEIIHGCFYFIGRILRILGMILLIAAPFSAGISIVPGLILLCVSYFFGGEDYDEDKLDRSVRYHFLCVATGILFWIFLIVAPFSAGISIIPAILFYGLNKAVYYLGLTNEDRLELKAMAEEKKRIREERWAEEERKEKEKVSLLGTSGDPTDVNEQFLKP